MPFPVVVAGPLRPGSGTQPGSPHSFHENRPPDAPRLLRHALPRGCCWTTPPWLWHPARFTPQLPRKPSAGCASTVAACASPWLLLDHSALALAPSQVHPTASTKTVRRMRLDRCWIRFPVVVCWTTPPWLWHPARFTPQLPRKPSAGCASTVAACASPWLLLDHSALALAPSQVHPTARSLNSRRPRPQ
jgi:hypothetical protein